MKLWQKLLILSVVGGAVVGVFLAPRLSDGQAEGQVEEAVAEVIEPGEEMAVVVMSTASGRGEIAPCG